MGRPGHWTISERPSVAERVRALRFDRGASRLYDLNGAVSTVSFASGLEVESVLDSRQGPTSIAVCPETSRLAVGMVHREVFVHSLATRGIEDAMRGHQAPVVHVAFGSDERLLSVDASGSIRTWDLERASTLAIFGAPKTTQAELIDGDHILSITDGRFRADRDSITLGAANGETVVAWRALNSPLLEARCLIPNMATGRWADATNDAPPRVTWSGDGYRNVCLGVELPGLGDGDSYTVFWLGRFGGRRGARQSAYSLGTSRGPWRDLRPAGGSSAFGNSLARSADDRFIAEISTIRHGSPVIVRDVAAGTLAALLKGSYNAVCFTPDSKRLFAARTDGLVDVFETGRWTENERLDAHEGVAFCVAVSPDGTRVATGGNDNALRIWDAETLEPLVELPGHRSYMMQAVWSPDGTMLASASGDLGHGWSPVERA